MMGFLELGCIQDTEDNAAKVVIRLKGPPLQVHSEQDLFFLHSRALEGV